MQTTNEQVSEKSCQVSGIKFHEADAIFAAPQACQSTTNSNDCSPELELANQRLLTLRQQLQRSKTKPNTAPNSLDEVHSNPTNFYKDLQAQLPGHLGWGSETLSKKLRIAQKPSKQSHQNTSALITLTHNSINNKPSHNTAQDKPSVNHREIAKTTVKLHHDIALGMLQHNLAGAGRLWLLLRYLDKKGQGWLYKKQIRQQLIQKESPLRICGRRHLQNLIHEGNGRFWHNAHDRLWLYGTARTAAALSISRLSGYPVCISLKALLSDMRTVKAHLYASFHSGRKFNNPISRKTLAKLTGVPVRTQLIYEEITDTAKRRNFALGEQYSKEGFEKRAWKNGRATFKFTDYQGKQGPKQRQYIAWWLPNSYTGCHHQTAKGRMKKINRKLKDLVDNMARGNSSEQVNRVFFGDGAKAVLAMRNHPQIDRMCPMNRKQHKKELWYANNAC